MPNVEESASPEDAASRGTSASMTAAPRVRRRGERLDVLIASAVLLLLIFGWVKDFAADQRWPGSGLLTASGLHHAWSGGALR